MGTINFGTQTLSYDFKNPGTSLSFNEINYKLIPPGIYEGGLLTKISDSVVELSTLTCYIIDSLNNLGVKIRTSTSENINIYSTTPYIILRFIWQNVEDNYMDMLAVNYSSILSDDIVIGRGIFDGVTLSSTFDYSLRTDASLKLLDLNKNSFLVTPSDPISNIINISSGTCILNGKFINFLGDSLTITNNTTLGRNDVVYIDDTGTLQILYGIDSVSPITPQYLTNTLAVAEIKRGATKTTVNGSEIFQIKPNREQCIIQINNNQTISSTSQTIVPSEYVVSNYINSFTPFLTYEVINIALDGTNPPKPQAGFFTKILDSNLKIKTVYEATTHPGFTWGSGLFPTKVNNTRYYLYLTTDGLYGASTNAPTYDNQKLGWYDINGNKVYARFRVLNDGSIVGLKKYCSSRLCQEYIQIEDQKATNIAGGSNLANVWTPRDLNTIVMDETLTVRLTTKITVTQTSTINVNDIIIQDTSNAFGTVVYSTSPTGSTVLSLIDVVGTFNLVNVIRVGGLAVGTPTAANSNGNQVYLIEGTYSLENCFSVYANTSIIRTRIRDITNNNTLGLSLSGNTASGNLNVYSSLQCKFTIASPIVLELQYYTTTVRAGNGLGIQTNIAGVLEVYSFISIIRTGG